MTKEIVFQDGGQFYTKRSCQSDCSCLGYGCYAIIADCGRVRDFDAPAAERARKWFVEVWCPKNGVEPVWVVTDVTLTGIPGEGP